MLFNVPMETSLKILNHIELYNYRRSSVVPSTSSLYRFRFFIILLYYECSKTMFVCVSSKMYLSQSENKCSYVLSKLTLKHFFFFVNLFLCAPCFETTFVENEFKILKLFVISPTHVLSGITLLLRDVWNVDNLQSLTRPSFSISK